MATVEIQTLVAPNPGPFTLDGTRTYVLNREVVIDPGPAIDEHVERIAAAAPHLQAIFITHRHTDHTPAAAALKARTGAIVCAPPGVLAETANEVLKDGAIRQIGSVRVEAVATPGHTPEHFCFLTAQRDLFSGDAILGEGTTIIEGQLREYLESLHRLREREPRAIYPGHGPVRRDAIEWIDYYLAHRAEREQQILDALGRGANTRAAIRAIVYPDVDAPLHGAAEAQIAAHLGFLVENGRVALSGDDYILQE